MSFTAKTTRTLSFRLLLDFCVRSHLVSRPQISCLSRLTRAISDKRNNITTRFPMCLNRLQPSLLQPTKRFCFSHSLILFSLSRFNFQDHINIQSAFMYTGWRVYSEAKPTTTLNFILKHIRARLRRHQLRHFRFRTVPAPTPPQLKRPKTSTMVF